MPRELMLQLKDKYGLRDFIETGTFHGKTAVWASEHFDNVKTIEASADIYDRTVKKHGKIENIEFILGDSGAEIKKIIP